MIGDIIKIILGIACYDVTAADNSFLHVDMMSELHAENIIATPALSQLVCTKEK